MSEPVITTADVLAEIQRLLRELDIDDPEGAAHDELLASSETPVWQDKTNVQYWRSE